jgi:hypothetical protein
MGTHEAVIDIGFSGAGYLPATALKTDNHFAMLDISAKRVESLTDADWEEKDRNAIVARIARMTMTTISSTRVKAERELRICLPVGKVQNAGCRIGDCFLFDIHPELCPVCAMNLEFLFCVGISLYL